MLLAVGVIPRTPVPTLPRRRSMRDLSDLLLVLDALSSLPKQYHCRSTCALEVRSAAVFSAKDFEAALQST